MTSSRSVSPVEEQYQQFLAEYRKSISNGAEYEMRLRIFEEKLKFIEETNSQINSFKVGVNQFADMTDQEYSKYLGYRSIINKSPAKTYTGKVANAIDWRTNGAVNTVQNQGSCGSCWAFSAVAAYEGAYFLKTGKLLKFSEQQLVDCSKAQKNEGCNGGLMDQAFDYLKTTPFCTESSYPYTAADGTCKDTSECAVPDATVSSYTDVTPKSGDELKAALNLQPVSVAIQANQIAFQLYKSGVFNSRCGTNLDHGVTAVGYGTDSGKDYWIVRNSWGGSWGEEGYIRLSSDPSLDTKGGTCGILLDSSYPKA
jgi:C1A family cysteine protease